MQGLVGVGLGVGAGAGWFAGLTSKKYKAVHKHIAIAVITMEFHSSLI